MSELTVTDDDFLTGLTCLFVNAHTRAHTRIEQSWKPVRPVRAAEWLFAETRVFVISLSNRFSIRFGEWDLLTACYHEDLHASAIGEIAREIIRSMGGEVCGEDYR